MIVLCACRIPFPIYTHTNRQHLSDVGGGATDYGLLNAAEAEAQRLRGELEASQRTKEEQLRREA